MRDQAVDPGVYPDSTISPPPMLQLRATDYFSVPELPVAVLSMPSQLATPLHRHDFAELAIITGGAALHVTEQGSYPVAAGDVFFIPPEQVHGFSKPSSLSLCNVLFLPKRMQGPSKVLQAMPGYQALFELEPRYRDAQGSVGHLRLPSTELERVIALVREIETESKSYAPGGEDMLQAMFIQLVVMLSRSYGKHSSAGGRRLLAVQKAIRRIESSHTEIISIIELARLTGMAPTTFKRIFKTVTGVSPINYVLQLRLARACHHLRDVEKTVTEAAMAAGFNDSNYFARQFRQRMGCTPREWRVSNRVGR